AGLTALVQSSSVTTILVVGLVQAEVIGLTRAVGVIFGANVGTTVTTQIIAFHVARFGLLFIGAGVPIHFLARREAPRQAGSAMVGFGLLLFGMEVMSHAVAPLRGEPALARLLASLSSPLAGLAAGLVATVVLQSSAAVTGLLVALAEQGVLPLEAAIAVVLGANVGTCLKINLAAAGKSREAVRAAAAHLLFNLVGAAVWVGFVPAFAELLRQLTPGGGGAALPRQVANAHTLFNLVNAAALLPFAPLFARGVRRLVPDRPEELRFETRYLDEEFLASPAQALAAVRQEARRMGWTLDAMLAALPDALFRADVEAMREIAAKDDFIDYLDRQLTRYLRLISAEDLAPREAQEVMVAIGVVNEIEHMGDVIELDLGHLVRRLHATG
ncbi:MAG: Na/Pi cotransporter family protein, partial [Nitrospirae bacterium]